MTSSQPDPDEIMEMERCGNAFLQAGDIDSLTDYFDDDSLVLSNGAAIISGKENIRQVFTMIAESSDWVLSWEPTRAVVSASNDMAYVYGTAKIKTPEDEAAKDGKYLIVYIKQDGAWRVAVDMQNTDS